MGKEKPLVGGNYKSDLSEKFKFSDKYDKAGQHTWTMSYSDGDKAIDFPLESIPRDRQGKALRFWNAKSRAKGSGYVQLPVIFLSLRRLSPIGEDKSAQENSKLVLTDEEQKFYIDNHNQILILQHQSNQSQNPAPLGTSKGSTLAMDTDTYDWKQNSAGQDNIGQILLSVLSFKRLKDKYSDKYKGGILVIDEIDATLFPASQEELVKKLLRWCSDYDLQIIFTTHSLTILEQITSMMGEPNRDGQLALNYLESSNQQLVSKEIADFQVLKNHLSVQSRIHTPEKVIVFTEDKEAQYFVKSLLGTGLTRYLRFINCTLGHAQIIELSRQKVPGFNLGESLIILDGDVSSAKISKYRNILKIPGSKSPESELACLLHKLPDNDSFWQDNYGVSNGKQICFKEFSLQQINSNREDAKNWFNQNAHQWGKGGSRVFALWKDAHKDSVLKFKQEIQNFLVDNHNLDI